MKKRFANAVKEGINEYYIKRVEEKYFNGYICLVKMKNVKKPWIVKDDELEDCILDENYEWLEIYPDNEKYAITAMFDDNNNLIEWYFDISKNVGIENGIPYEDDLYIKSDLPEKSYYKALGAVAVMNYKKTAFKILKDKVNKNNINEVLEEWNEFIDHDGKNDRKDSNETVKLVERMLLEIKADN